MHAKDRSSLVYKVGYAVQHPDRIVGYARRRGRDTWLWLTTRDHVSYYRAVMRSDTARSSDAAVGSKTRESWLKIGQMQFDYLIKHGLKPDMRMLEIGCGNLRAGRLFIDYLDSGNYYGTDISPDILLAAQKTVGEYGLQRKMPYIALVSDLKLDFLPDDHFDRRPRAQRVLALPAAGHRRVPDPRRADHDAGRDLRLHLRQDRGQRAPGAPRGFLLPGRRRSSTSRAPTDSRPSTWRTGKKRATSSPRSA